MSQKEQITISLEYFLSLIANQKPAEPESEPDKSAEPEPDKCPANRVGSKQIMVRLLRLTQRQYEAGYRVGMTVIVEYNPDGSAIHRYPGARTVLQSDRFEFVTYPSSTYDPGANGENPNS